MSTFIDTLSPLITARPVLFLPEGSKVATVGDAIGELFGSAKDTAGSNRSTRRSQKPR